jgi:hypothetical protein
MHLLHKTSIDPISYIQRIFFFRIVKFVPDAKGSMSSGIQKNIHVKFIY